ncbi:hypothetical protein AGLY_015416 [Aphis glycines]|uniref:C2H2-type domain-containing protein n=1 Tax=Aphis glycines TaxID=307491 RepID=A0A6G0T2M4_APHGL|nr:hypothetical protein AGLY_015416 [Aphis glycines]
MFKCEECSFKCNFEGDFKKHKKMHKGGVSFSCPLCTLKFNSRSVFLGHMSDIHDIGGNSKPYKREVIAENNVSHDEVRHSCDSCDSTFSLRGSLLRHKRSTFVYKNQKRYNGQVAQVPDIQSEPDVIDIASYNLRPRNPLGVVCKNEYLYKGKRCALRKLHEEYVEAQHSQDKWLVWVSHADSLSQKLNLDMQVIAMLMMDIYADYSTPIDENLIQMLHQDSLFYVENIQHHTQYYIFVQLVYGLMKIYEMGFENLQTRRKSNWKKNTITILEYFEFTDETADFLIERIENFI